ncbi:hypothetical protein HPCPY3281_0704 [Helicobacter pylori CPY3281]|nr:hypothetical protein HPCPY3281_0704 [Helicobacter pylori CPY3281]
MIPPLSQALRFFIIHFDDIRACFFEREKNFLSISLER